MIDSRPTRARYWVIVLAVTLAIITYIDRVCISQAAPLMTRDLGLSSVEKGYIFSAFTLAYALFEIPGGWMGDFMGPRKVLMRIVVWWSFFTAATGSAWSFLSLLITRFLFGAGEAGCFPNLTKAFTAWLPSYERVRAQGIMWMSARWGGAFTPLLVVWVLKYVSWRRAFEIFGGIGIVWAFFFYRWYRDNPTRHPSVNAAELALMPRSEESLSGHVKVPWGKLLSSRTVWMLWIQYAALSYPWYFYITWLPTYLQEARRLEPQRAAILAGLPLLFGGVGCLVSGLFFSPLNRWTGSVAKSRRITALTGFCGASALLLLSSQQGDPVLASLIMGFASFANDLTMPGSWATCMDVGGRWAGTLSGSMNMMGNLGGSIAPVAIGYILQATHNNWSLTFYLASAVYLVGAACWTLIDPVTAIDRPLSNPSH
jgi:ACS family glucarate transporter-like MFS transporter